MEATVNADYPVKVLTAFGGREFVKGEWRAVPAGCEAEATKHLHLDTRETPVVEPEAEGGEQSAADDSPDTPGSLAEEIILQEKSEREALPAQPLAETSSEAAQAESAVIEEKAEVSEEQVDIKAKSKKANKANKEKAQPND